MEKNLNNKFLIGHSIELRVPSEEDIAHSNWHSWYNDISITQYNSHGIYPIDKEKEYKFLKETLNKDDTILCSIYDLKHKNLVGNAALQNIDLINKHCNIAITIGGDTTFTAPVEVYGLLINHAFMRLNLERVHDGTHEKLQKLIYMLSVIGFEEEGISKNYFLRNNNWYSKINFAVLKDNFLSLKKTRDGNILFNDEKLLQRAIIEAIKTHPQ